MSPAPWQPQRACVTMVTVSFFFLLRKSFFSGHASFSMYTMLYLVVSVLLLHP